MSTKKRATKKPVSTKSRIRVCENGPYEVSGGVPLTVYTIVTDSQGIPVQWKAGKKYPVQETYELCRCGKSKNKPFCDGSHKQAKFNGTDTASRQPFLDEAQVLEGPGLTLTDLPDLCVHAGFCDRASGIWNLTQYSDTPEARKIAIEEAANCPSGRLVIWDKDGHIIEPEFEPSIEVVEDPETGVGGPLWVRGGIPVESVDGSTYEIRNRVTLCRCGKSDNKPFCDGMHLQQLGKPY